MENWDLVKMHSRALRSEHYIEAMAVGYQLLESVFIVLLTKTTVGNQSKPLGTNKVKKANYLLAKAKLALKYDFIDQNLYDEVVEFNELRRDLIHNIVEKDMDYNDAKKCANLVTDLYGKIQSQFLTYTITEVNR